MTRITSVLLFIGVALISCSQLGTDQDATNQASPAQSEDQSGDKIPDPTEKLTAIIARNNIPKSQLRIRIEKSRYALSVLHKDSVLITYPCVFGFNAVDDKAQEGDGCTPEGTFGVRSMYAHKNWEYFIWIDYPNAESWRRFNERKANGTIEKSATIGGEVGIHGVPEGGDYLIDNQSNWTLGCISLKNAHITDLYKSITSNVKIEIVH